VALGQNETELLVRAQNLTAEVFKQVNADLRTTGKLAESSGQIGGRAFGPMGKAVGDISGALSSMGGVMGGLAIGKMALDFFELTGNLSDTSVKLGLNTTQLQRFSYAGDTAGITVDDISRAIGKLEANVGAEDAGALGAIGKLGINFDELKAKNPGDQFEDIASRLSKIENPAQRAHLAIEIFGKSGIELMPLLRQDLKAVGDEAERVGAVLSEDVIEAGDELGDLWSKAKAASRSLVAEGLRPLLNTVKQMSDPGELARWEKFKASLNTFGSVDRMRSFNGYLQATIDLLQRAGSLKLPQLAPGGPGKNFDPKTFAIPLPKLSPKELNEYYDQLKRDNEEWVKSLKLVDEHAAKIKKLGETYRGLDAVTAARDAIEALHREERAGFSISDMTRDRAAALNKTISEAIDVNLRAGRLVPPEWVRIARETTFASMQGVEDITALIQAVEGLQKVALQVPVLIPRLGVTGGIAAGSKIGQDVGIPTAPEISKLFQIFGTSKDFGAQMASTVLGAIQGVGNPVAAAAGQVGGQVATHVAAELTTQGGKYITGALAGVLKAGLPIVGDMLGPAVAALLGKLFGTAGRDTKLQMAKDVFGSVEDMQKQLVGLGQAQYDRLWKQFSEVGQNNKGQAKAAIDAITAALDAQKLKQQEVTQASEESAAAQQEALDAIAAKYSDSISQLETEYKSLSDSVSKEAEEQFMGIAESNDRARMKQIEIERADLEEKKAAEIQNAEDTYAATQEAARKAADETDRALREIFDRGYDTTLRIRNSFPDGFPDGPSVPQHGDGGYFDTPHMAVVGDRPEYITPRESVSQLAGEIAAAMGGRAAEGADARAFHEAAQSIVNAVTDAVPPVSVTVNVAAGADKRAFQAAAQDIADAVTDAIRTNGHTRERLRRALVTG
jgi:hypothetical protein